MPRSDRAPGKKGGCGGHRTIGAAPPPRAQRMAALMWSSQEEPWAPSAGQRKVMAKITRGKGVASVGAQVHECGDLLAPRRPAVQRPVLGPAQSWAAGTRPPPCSDPASCDLVHVMLRHGGPFPDLGRKGAARGCPSRPAGPT